MNNTHIATFVGAIKKKRYEYGRLDDIICWSSYEPKIIKEVFEEEYEVIQSEQFFNPPMPQGDKVKLDLIDKVVLIKEVIRDSDGGYIYYTNHVIKEIEDDKTIETLHKANEEKLEEEKKKLERLEKELKQKEKLTYFVEIPSKKWYQFWK